MRCVCFRVVTQQADSALVGLDLIGLDLAGSGLVALD